MIIEQPERCSGTGGRESSACTCRDGPEAELTAKVSAATCLIKASRRVFVTSEGNH